MVKITVNIGALSVDEAMNLFEIDGIVDIFNPRLIWKEDGAGSSRSIVDVIEA